MCEINRKDKYETYVHGLDDLLYGGIQLRPLGNQQTEGNNRKEEGTIVVIRGARGVYKTQLALQLVHGLTLSCKKNNYGAIFADSMFFSINKQKEQLEDALVDLMISSLIFQIKKENMEDDGLWNGTTFCDFFFEAKPLIKEEDLEKIKNHKLLVELLEECKRSKDLQLIKDKIYYNNRTGSLHVHWEGEDLPIYKRKHDKIEEFCGRENGNEDIGKNLMPVYINAHTGNQQNVGVENSYAHTSLQELHYIVNYIEDGRNSDHGRNPSSNTKSDPSRLIPCLAIDGFTQLSAEEMSAVNFGHIEKVLRKNALLSILVFDENESFIKCNADLVINMQRVEEEVLKYTYHQLRIAKCVFQSIAYGWHQYKVRDYGIEIYKSIHLLIQKRRYMPNILSAAHEGFADYCLHQEEKSFIYKKDEQKQKAWDMIADNCRAGGVREENLLKNILEWGDEEPRGEVTAVLGGRNAMKRLLSLDFLFTACYKKQHTLLVSWGEDEKILMQNVVCPAKKPEDKKLSDRCPECFNYLHLFALRMGCLDTDEFFYFLTEQIKLKYKGERIKRIVFWDLVQVDYRFPFLKVDPLFLPGLFALAKQYECDVFIVCTNYASLAPSLFTIADNVICSWQDYNKTTQEEELFLHVDKSVQGKWNAYTYSVKRKNELCHCSTDGLVLKSDLVAVNGRSIAGKNLSDYDLAEETIRTITQHGFCHK